MKQSAALHDLIIVGGGPAGLTAAVYATRKMLNVRLITQNIGGQVLYSLNVENYMGYQFISGPDLMDRFEKQVEKYNVQRTFAQVKSVEQRTRRIRRSHRDRRRVSLKNDYYCHGKKVTNAQCQRCGEIRWSRR